MTTPRAGLVMVAVVACGAPAATTVTTTMSKPAPSPRPPPPASAGPAVVHAPPATAMTVVAVSADGRAAYTGGDAGDGRLWPTLDGSVEPVAVDLPAALDAVLSRDGDGFEVAVVDAAGGVAIAALDRDGRVTARAAVAAKPVVRQLAIVAAGLLARRDDSLALLDWQGHELAQLDADDGEQLVAIAGNGREAVVAVERDDATALHRVMATGRTLAWGDPAGDVASDRLTMSPSGDFVATVIRQLPDHQLVITDRSGRRVVDSPIAERPLAIGFVDDDTVAAFDDHGIAIAKRDGAVTHRPLPGYDQVHGFGRGAAVSALDTELRVSTATDDSYIGYGVLVPEEVAAGPGSSVMVSAPDGMQLLDGALAPVPGGAVAIDGHSASQINHLAGDDWFVQTGSRLQPGTAEYFVHAGAVTPLPPTVLYPLVLDAWFEPSTQLLATISDDARRSLRYDPVGHALRAEPALVTRTDPPDTYVTATPVAPALADGIRLMTVTRAAHHVVSWYRDDAEQSLANALDLDTRSVVAVDRAGHVFAANADQTDIAVFDHAGVQRAVLPRRTEHGVVPDRDGARIAQLAEDGVYVDDRTGKPLWHADGIVGRWHAAWLDDGSLVVPTETGVARLDGRTGAVLALRCSWSFGRTAAPHHQRPRGESECVRTQRATR